MIHTNAFKEFLIWLHWTLVILGIYWIGATGIEAYKLNFVTGYADRKALAQANVIIEQYYPQYNEPAGIKSTKK